MEVYQTISFQGRVRYYDNTVFPFMCFWGDGVGEEFIGTAWPVLNNIPTKGFL